MFNFQVRPRIFRHEVGHELNFPADCEIRFHLLPLQPFGAEPGNGRTLVKGEEGTLLFNANSGRHTVESSRPLAPLDVEVEEDGGRSVKLTGNVLLIKEHFHNLGDLASTLNSVYFCLPALLNIPFADPPFVERVEGLVGTNRFRWELDNWQFELRPTTQQQQESAVLDAWLRMGCIAEPHRRRLVAALHYFHVACRLSRQANIPGEFLAEVVLNLAKALEVLFPASADEKQRDAVRSSLKRLDFTHDEIEGRFVPALALRNELGVGHAQLAIFSMDQLRVVHAYVERAEDNFRTMFERLLKKIQSGTMDVAPYADSPRNTGVEKVIERIRTHLPKDGFDTSGPPTQPSPAT